MRILICSEFYHPRTGGAELVCKTIAEGLRARGHDVAIATSAASSSPAVWNGVDILPFGLSGNRVKGIRETVPGERARFVDLLVSPRWDVIVHYAAQTWHTDLAFDALNRITARKVIIPCGFSGLTGTLRRLLYWRYFRSMAGWLNRFDLCIYGDDEYLDARFAKDNGLTNGTVIPNGIDPQEFIGTNPDPALRARLGLPSGKRIILNVANHYRLKGHHRLIAAFSRSAPDDAVLVIVGKDPGGRTSCMHRCRRSAGADSRVFLLDDLPRSDVVRLYGECSLFVLASDIEFFPLVLLEAMYARKPIASTDVGCVTRFCKARMLTGDREFASTMAHAGSTFPEEWLAENRRRVETTYNWPRILDAYEAAICRG